MYIFALLVLILSPAGMNIISLTQRFTRTTFYPSSQHVGNRSFYLVSRQTPTQAFASLGVDEPEPALFLPSRAPSCTMRSPTASRKSLIYLHTSTHSSSSSPVLPSEIVSVTNLDLYRQVTEPRRRVKRSKRLCLYYPNSSACQRILLKAGDISTNPGPAPKCLACNTTVRRNQVCVNWEPSREADLPVDLHVVLHLEPFLS